MKAKTPIDPELLRRWHEMQRIGNRAVRRVQEENRRLGIPNWYSINGVIVSDRELARLKSKDSL